MFSFIFLSLSHSLFFPRYFSLSLFFNLSFFSHFSLIFTVFVYLSISLFSPLSLSLSFSLSIFFLFFLSSLFIFSLSLPLSSPLSLPLLSLSLSLCFFSYSLLCLYQTYTFLFFLWPLMFAQAIRKQKAPRPFCALPHMVNEPSSDLFGWLLRRKSAKENGGKKL